MAGKSGGGNGDQDKGRARDHYSEQAEVERLTRIAREASKQQAAEQGGDDNGGTT